MSVRGEKMKKMLYVLLATLLILQMSTEAFAQVNYYLDKAYVINPLGEGEDAPYAKGPLFRDDAFDCTTYVEALLAQHKSQENTDDFLENLLLLRYSDGELDFFKRAHFMEFQWIPNALKQGFIEEYPLELAEEYLMEIDMETWFLQNNSVKNKDDAYKNKAKEQKNIQFSFSFIPKNKIDNFFVEELSNEMVVFFLRELPANTIAGQKNKQKHITHMGIINNGVLYHASSTKKKVVRVNFIDYLNANKGIVGIALYLIP